MPDYLPALLNQHRGALYDQPAPNYGVLSGMGADLKRAIANAVNNPLPMDGRLSIIPAMVRDGQRELAVPGILASMWNAFTAPGRALSGQLDVGNPAQAIPEALNFAGAMNMGSMPAPLAGGPGTLAMNVYHGSPHKFDKFDMSKIGTGEGAQAYGHGLYFAENPSVSRSYKFAGAPSRIAEGGSPTNPMLLSGVESQLDALMNNRLNAGLTFDEAKAQSLSWLKNSSQWTNDKSALSKGESFLGRIEQNSGNLYKVDLPDSSIAKMLDWDAPLSKQPEAVQPVLKAMLEKARKSFPQLDPAGDPIAGQIHHLYAQHRGGNAAAVAEELKAAGIPGIRYLDQGSRAVGKGTSNFVVFDDQLPKIIGRE